MIAYYRWGYRRKAGSHTDCVPDEEVNYNVVLPENWKNDKKPKNNDSQRKNVNNNRLPWALKAVYALNRAAEYIFHVTLG